jgi:hypothetical protein
MRVFPPVQLIPVRIVKDNRFMGSSQKLVPMSADWENEHANAQIARTLGMPLIDSRERRVPAGCACTHPAEERRVVVAETLSVDERLQDAPCPGTSPKFTAQ